MCLRDDRPLKRRHWNMSGESKLPCDVRLVKFKLLLFSEATHASGSLQLSVAFGIDRPLLTRPDVPLSDVADGTG